MQKTCPWTNWAARQWTTRTRHFSSNNKMPTSIKTSKRVRAPCSTSSTPNACLALLLAKFTPGLDSPSRIMNIGSTTSTTRRTRSTSIQILSEKSTKIWTRTCRTASALATCWMTTTHNSWQKANCTIAIWWIKINWRNCNLRFDPQNKINKSCSMSVTKRMKYSERGQHQLSDVSNIKVLWL